MPRKKRRRFNTARSKIRKIKGGRVPRHKANKQKHAFRDIVKDGVTYSFLSDFLGCREQARLTYVEGYSQAGIIDPLEFGSLFHACCEASAKAKGGIQSYKVVAEYIKQKKARSKIAKKDVSKLEFQAKIVAAMYPLYHSHWRDNDGLEFQGTTKFVAQELPFQVNHQLPDGNVMPIRGRFDAILRKGSTGKLWLMETKTKSQIDHEGITSLLSSMDLQTMLYCLAIHKHFGEYPEGVLYNVIKRPLLRQKQTETEAEFLARIQDDVQSRSNDYFMRWHVSIRKEDVLDWTSRCLDPILMQVQMWWDSIKDDPLNPWKSPHHFVNPEGLHTRYGKSKYFDLLTRGVPVGLQQREFSPPEVKKGKKK